MHNPYDYESYYDLYTRCLKLCGQPLHCYKVPTGFGNTHVIEMGPKDAPPLILLPGMNSSSTIWCRQIDALSREFRILALDIVGDAGRSSNENPPKDRLDYRVWLGQVMSALGIDQVDIAGISYGGFLAMSFAIGSPHRVRKLVLLAPAGLLKARLKFLIHAWWVTKLPSRERFEKFARTMSAYTFITDGLVMNQMLAHLRESKVRPRVKAGVFTDDELRRISMPTLLLLGDKEIIYNPETAMRRALRFIPNVQVRVISPAGHVINLDQPEAVNERMLTFLKS